MAKLNYHNPKTQLFPPVVSYDTSNNDESKHEQEQEPHSKQLQVLLRVARMRRRSQRQLLVQIEQEQHQQRSVRVTPSLYQIGTCIEISRSCARTITEEIEDGDEFSFGVKSLSSSSSSLNGIEDDS